MGTQSGWDVGKEVVSYLLLVVTFAASPSP
jgi:hypothetical protein